jgi:glycosyltransferase involved in cell wall biosynthesis
MPTVLLDLSVLSTGARTLGIGRYVADLATGLMSVTQGTRFRVLGVERISLLGREQVTEDLSAAVARLSDRRVATRAHVDWAYRVRVGLARAARHVTPDLVHTGHPGATPLGKFACPRVTTCHDLIPLRYPRQYLTWRDGYQRGRQHLDQRRFHTATHVIAVSETSANDLVTLLGIPASKITVVHNGVDLERWSSEPGENDAKARERLGVAERSYILSVGDTNWRKNPEGVLRALSIARRALGSHDLTLVWAARISPVARAKLTALAATLGVQNALILPGYVSDEDLGALYRGAVAQVFVSRAEGFGYPALEAMASGCPVITSDRSSMAEIAADAAILVDPESHEAIAEPIAQLTRDPEERRRWARRGVERAARFSLAAMAQRTLDVYEQVIAQR